MNARRYVALPRSRRSRCDVRVISQPLACGTSRQQLSLWYWLRMRRVPRVLVVAEAANPEWASVPLIGWSLSRALADVADVHLVTQVRNRSAIERAGWREGHEFTAIDSEAVARPVFRAGEVLRRLTGLGWTATTAFAAVFTYYFERLVWERFGAAIRSKQFDVVHRVTPVSPTIPSLLAGRCRAAGVPFVWGPLNGGVPWPREFSDVRRQEGESLSYLRGAHRLLPGYSKTRQSAAAIIAGSRSLWDQMTGYHDRCVYIVENAVDPERFVGSAAAVVDGPLRVAFVGRLVPYKGADMLIEAAAPLVRSNRVVLDIVGDGPQRDALTRQVNDEGLHGVTLAGWVAHPEVGRRLARSEVFAFPSVREFGGGVVLEAMQLGLIPVVVDYAGPAELVTDSSGFRVPLGPRAAIVSRFREVLTALADRPAYIEPMKQCARERVERWYTWRAKSHQIAEVYEWVLGHRAKPNFGMPYPDLVDSATTVLACAPETPNRTGPC